MFVLPGSSSAGQLSPVRRVTNFLQQSCRIRFYFSAEIIQQHQLFSLDTLVCIFLCTTVWKCNFSLHSQKQDLRTELWSDSCWQSWGTHWASLESFPISLRENDHPKWNQNSALTSSWNKIPAPGFCCSSQPPKRPGTSGNATLTGVTPSRLSGVHHSFPGLWMEPLCWNLAWFPCTLIKHLLCHPPRCWSTHAGNWPLIYCRRYGWQQTELITGY